MFLHNLILIKSNVENKGIDMDSIMCHAYDVHIEKVLNLFFSGEVAGHAAAFVGHWLDLSFASLLWLPTFSHPLIVFYSHMKILVLEVVF